MLGSIFEPVSIFKKFLQMSNQWPLSGDLKIFLFYKKSIKSNGQERSTFLALKVWKRDEYGTYGTEKAQRAKKITKKEKLETSHVEIVNSHP